MWGHRMLAGRLVGPLDHPKIVTRQVFPIVPAVSRKKVNQNIRRVVRKHGGGLPGLWSLAFKESKSNTGVKHSALACPPAEGLEGPHYQTGSPFAEISSTVSSPQLGQIGPGTLVEVITVCISSL